MERNGLAERYAASDRWSCIASGAKVKLLTDDEK